MAQYTITHACGHTTIQQLYGKHDDRDRKIAWWETVDCPTCYGKAQAARRAQETQRNAEIKASIDGTYISADGKHEASISVISHDTARITMLADNGLPASQEISVDFVRAQIANGAITRKA